MFLIQDVKDKATEEVPTVAEIPSHHLDTAIKCGERELAIVRAGKPKTLNQMFKELDRE